MSDLRAVLMDIKTRRGVLTSQTVVDEARAPDAPLHDRFEWDDAIAGEAYRRNQAAELMRSAQVEYISPASGERKKVRAFHSVRLAGVTGGEGYAPIEELLGDPLAKQILLRQCQREIADLKAKYNHLSEFAELMQAAIN